ncbi:hypothetical protein J4E93_000468 [Alternaria ventricosa]|uniref:uncharacterized protein n=1 Tax=Alternaria ventricosa TaxID=1187951 RepID=UPI0020C1C00A|nr:uncharacterized protein J4E93_000468 [Alternaria ventricosa]KAI4655753.1 hypothetical protein J4E93_000468 [Alternaria ventricosa]
MSTLGTSKGLLELYHIPADASTLYTSGNDYSNSAGIGFGHIGFTVPDVTEALERINSFGYEVIKPLGEAKEEQMGLPAKAVDGTHGKVPDGYKHVFKQLAFVKDPDSIITSRSKFFANALSGRWNNSDAKTINLYEVNPELRSEDVEHYLETVYTNRITLKDDSRSLESICHVYVIAELLLDLHTRNLATQALYEQISFRESYGYVVHTNPGPECIKIIYEGTVAGDLMRELLVHSWCGLGRHGLLQCDDLPKRFLSELATAALKEEQGPLLYHLDTYLEDNS